MWESRRFCAISKGRWKAWQSRFCFSTLSRVPPFPPPRLVTVVLVVVGQRLDEELLAVEAGNGKSGELYQPVALHPLVASFTRDPIATTQLRHRPLSALVVVHKTLALVHHTTHIPWHVLLLHATDVRTKLSTISPVCSVNYVPGLYPVGAPCFSRGSWTSGQRKRSRI